VTDHAPNTWLETQPNLNRRQARWSEYFQRFKLLWQYRPGRNNVADPLSRNPAFLIAIGSGADSLSSVGEAIKAGYVLASHVVDDSFALAHGLAQEGDFWYKDEQIFVPDVEGLRLRCLRLVHNPNFCGHLGGNRTYQSAKQLFRWEGMKADALQFVKDCQKCQCNKHSNTKPVGLLRPLQVPSFRWESVSMDFIVQLPVTKHGKDAIVVFVDRLSKMVHFAATTTTVTAEETAHIFRHEVFRLHGMPQQLVSDRDTRFTSAFWKEVCRLLGIEQGMSTAFHPQTDGQTERTNRILEDMLRHYVNPMLCDWDEHLDAVEFAVNSAWQESIRTSPFMLNYGQRPRMPTEFAFTGNVPAAVKFTHDWQLTVQKARTLLDGAEQRHTAAAARRREADAAVHLARNHLMQAQKKQKLQADKRRSPEPLFGVGDQVLLSTKHIQLKNPGARKLLPLWIGPFKVLERVGKVAYKLQLADGMKMHNVFHVSLLKAYRDDGTVQPPPPPELIDGELEYEVEQVISFDEKRKRYLVKWLGYGHENNTWEQERNVANAPDKTAKYWQMVQLRDKSAKPKRVILRLPGRQDVRLTEKAKCLD